MSVTNYANSHSHVCINVDSNKITLYGIVYIITWEAANNNVTLVHHNNKEVQYNKEAMVNNTNYVNCNISIVTKICCHSLD